MWTGAVSGDTLYTASAYVAWRPETFFLLRVRVVSLNRPPYCAHPMPRVTPSTLPVDDIRAQFPALQRTCGSQPVAYFDGPGGTQVPRPVVDAMADYLYHHNANTHWAYPTSAETDQALAAARDAFADFLNTNRNCIVFGNNMTTLTFHLARALGRSWNKGDEIVTTELDHHANIDPWRDVAAHRGLTVRTARMNVRSGQLDWDHFERLLSNRTRLVAVGAASNALGTINDVARAHALAHACGALSFVDAVHYAPHVLPDVEAMGCDFLACSSYKFYGPHAGILYGRQALLDMLATPRLLPAPNNAPERLETGTQNHEGIVGAAAAVDFLASLSEGPTRRGRLEATYAALHARSSAQVARLWNGLGAISRVTRYGPPPGVSRTPTVVFTIDGFLAKRVSRSLAAEGLFLSHGDFYAATVIERLDVEGLVRVGLACYATDEEVDRLLAAVQRLAATPR